MSGVRETQRRAWREAVARAAACLRATEDDPDFDVGDDGCLHSMWCYRKALREALSAPKPWARPAKADLGKWGANVRHFTPEHKAWVKRRGMWSSSKVDWRSLRRKRRAAQRRRR